MDFVYKLMHRRTGAVGYVGLTDDPKERLRQHAADDPHNPFKTAWVQQHIEEEGVMPNMRIVEVVYDGRKRGYQREQYWTHFYLRRGEPLTNNHNTHQRVLLEEDLFKGLVDVSTLALVYSLEADVYGYERTYRFPVVVSAWLKRNPRIYWYLHQAGSFPAPDDVLASLCILPLEESSVIARLWKGDLTIYDVEPGDILRYEPGRTYSCFVGLAAYRPGCEVYFNDLVRHVFLSLCSYGVIIDKLYMYIPKSARIIGEPLAYLAVSQFFSTDASGAARLLDFNHPMDLAFSSVANSYRQCELRGTEHTHEGVEIAPAFPGCGEPD